MNLIKKGALFFTIICSFAFLDAKVKASLNDIIGKKTSISLVDIPGISEIASTPAGKILGQLRLDNIALDMGKETQRATGQVEIFGQTVDGGVNVGKDAEGSRFLSTYISLPSGFNFADILKSLGAPSAVVKGMSAIDALTPLEGRIVVATSGYTDPKWGAIQRGLNFATTFGVDDKGLQDLGIKSFMQYMQDILRVKLDLSKAITFTGSIAPEFVGSRFSISLGEDILSVGRLWGTYLLELHGFNFGLEIQPTGVALNMQAAGGINIPLPKEITKAVTGEQVVLSAEADGMFAYDMQTNVIELFLDIKTSQENLEGFPFKEIGGRLGAKIVPKLIKFGGIAKLAGGFTAILSNDQKVEADAMLDIPDPNFFLDAKMDDITFKSLMQTLSDSVMSIMKIVGERPVDISKIISDAGVPNFGIKKYRLTFALLPTIYPPTDKGISYSPGLSVDFAADLFGAQPFFEGDLTLEKLTMGGGINEIDVGPIKLSGTDKGKKRDDDKKGPYFKLEVDPLAPQKSGLWADGKLVVDIPKMPKASGEVHAAVSPDGFRFAISTDLFDEFKMDFDVDARRFDKPQNWKITANMSQSALEKLSKLTSKAGEEVKKAFKKGSEEIDRAKKRLKPLKDEADKLKRKLDDAKRKCKGKAPKDAYQELEKVERRRYVVPEKQWKNQRKLLSGTADQINAQMNVWWGDRLAGLYRSVNEDTYKDFAWKDVFIDSGERMSLLTIAVMSAKEIIKDVLDEHINNIPNAAKRRPEIGFYMGLAVVDDVVEDFLASYKAGDKEWPVTRVIHNILTLYDSWPYKAKTEKNKRDQVQSFLKLVADVYQKGGIVPADNREQAEELAYKDFIAAGGTKTSLPTLESLRKFKGKWSVSKPGEKE